MASELIFDCSALVEIGAHALELRRPRDQRIGLVVVEHVPHGEGQRIQIILNPKKLERVAAISIDQIVLQFAQTVEICRVMYQEYATTAAMVMIRPRNRPAVGEGLGKDAMRREYNAKDGSANAPPFPALRLEIKL